MWKYILNYVSSNRNNYKNSNTNKYYTIYVLYPSFFKIRQIIWIFLININSNYKKEMISDIIYALFCHFEFIKRKLMEIIIFIIDDLYNTSFISFTLYSYSKEFMEIIKMIINYLVSHTQFKQRWTFYNSAHS